METARSHPTDRSSVLVVAACFTFALLIRLWNIRWGFPFNYHPDEHTVYDTAVQMLRTGQFDPQWFHWPSLLFYLQVGMTNTVHWLAQTPLEILTGPGISPGMIPEGQFAYLTAGRILVATMGAVSVAFMSATASMLGSRRFLPLLIGLVAALVPLHVEHSHYLTPDLPASFAVAVAIYGSVLLLHKGSNSRRLVLTAMAVGIAAGFKYNAALVALPAGLAVCMTTGSPARKTWRLFVVASLSAATFLATTPYAILNFDDFRAGLGFDAQHYWSGHTGHTTDCGITWVLRTLWNEGALGQVVMVTAALAIVLFFVSPRVRRQQGKTTAILTLYVCAYLALFATVRVSFARSLLPIVPGLVLLSAAGIQGMFLLVSSRPLRVVLAAVLVVSFLPTGWMGIRASWVLGLKRTETRAYQWFLQNVPPEANIIREMYTPQLPVDRYHVAYRFTLSDIRWDRWETLNLDYAVISSQVFRHYQRIQPGNQESHHRYRFYQELFAQPPVACFGPQPGNSVGPEIWIFARSRRAQQLHSERIEVGRCSRDWPWLLVL